MRQFEVVTLSSSSLDRNSHGVFDTLEEARGCVRLDKLNRWEINAVEGGFYVETVAESSHGPREIETSSYPSR